ncbi:hypothetical protein RIR_jg12103.t1 [Rhizophagus irregularis DAOM 181602=DAOM 197198]|nr:hypothetical protein RIR_jg12103.t1 [Rhizophagus irregularis DAOM 181602=DAOM 197198]
MRVKLLFRLLDVKFWGYYYIMRVFCEMSTNHHPNFIVTYHIENFPRMIVFLYYCIVQVKQFSPEYHI